MCKVEAGAGKSVQHRRNLGIGGVIVFSSSMVGYLANDMMGNK
jgi:hypothetical protein